MGSLNEQVIPTVAHKWSELAYALKFEFPEVEKIKKNHPLDVAGACSYVLGTWLGGKRDNQEPRTWATLLEAVRQIGNGELADEIQRGFH